MNVEIVSGEEALIAPGVEKGAHRCEPDCNYFFVLHARAFGLGFSFTFCVV